MLCEKPIYVENVGGLVSCGKCLPCRINHQRKWSFRLILEYMGSKEACWVTLTYNDHFKPMEYYDEQNGNIYSSGFGSLRPDHVRNFIKRLRKKLGKKKIRYFLCGEYGDQTNRPHYHLCLFGIGQHWEHVIKESWTDPISKLSLGNILVAPLTPENIKYTCGYTLKKMTKASDERLQGAYPEFIRHSLGIGKFSIDKISKAFDCKSLRLYYQEYGDIPRTFEHDGKQWPMDRYIRKKIVDHLNIKEDFDEKNQKRYKEEMYNMHHSALALPQFKGSMPSKAFALEYKYKLDNAQKVLNALNRHKIFQSTKEKKI